MSDEAKFNPEEQAMKDALKDWWIDKAHSEIASVVPKAVEYSSVDLVWIGRTLGMLLDRFNLNDEEATELGIFFYEIGKMGRWMGAIKEERRVSNDTLHDAGIYIKMAQRNRDVGGWPFGPNEDGI